MWRLAPSDPDLADALDRLSPGHVVPRRSAGPLDVEESTESGSFVDRIGVWAIKNLPGGAWAHTPRKDLAILQISETRFYGEKVVWALLGLAMPPLFAAFFAHKLLGYDPYMAAIGLTPLFFLIGYGLQRYVIGPAYAVVRGGAVVVLPEKVTPERSRIRQVRGPIRSGAAAASAGTRFGTCASVPASGRYSPS